MNCEGVYRRVSSYIDGELTATLVEEIELHMKGCRECAVFVTQTKLTVSWYHDSDLVDYPGEVQARLHETLRKKMKKRK
jgi:anti-sigma factor RsiW